MLQVIIKSCVRAEATVGIALVVLLITGRTDPQTIGLSLGVLGGVFLFSGLLPLLQRGSKVPQPLTPEEKALQEWENSSPSPPTPCDRRPATRRRYFAASASLCAVLLINAALVYWLSPAAV